MSQTSSTANVPSAIELRGVSRRFADPGGRSVGVHPTSLIVPQGEIHGIIGGYTEEGFKTVIPAKAQSKISFRLVAGQDPQKIRDAFRAHVRARIPADCSVEFIDHGASAATVMPIDGDFLGKALGALTEEWEREAAVAGSGGSIPIVSAFKEKLGMDSLLIGFARFDNRIHSPNEKYDLSSFRKGVRSWARILAAFADNKG